MTRGIVMIVYGDSAALSARRAHEALAIFAPDVPVHVHSETAGQPDTMRESRLAKVTMLDWSPFDETAYLDADTQLYSHTALVGFDLLADGFDLVITPSQNQDEFGFLWHCNDEDKAHTLHTLGFQPLQLQAGVFFARKNDRTRALWRAWREEWDLYGNQDQGALLRALHRVPVRLWLLGRAFNGGAAIGHHWGAIRRG